MIRRVIQSFFSPSHSSSRATRPTIPTERAKTGAGVGAAAGAVVGAVIGNQGGNNRTGAVVGAAAGAAIGAAIGHRMDKQQQELQQIPGVEVSRPSEGEIDVRLTSDILFDSIPPRCDPNRGRRFATSPTNFRNIRTRVFDVEGHTDSVGDDRATTMGLSQRRADSVRTFLATRASHRAHQRGRLRRIAAEGVERHAGRPAAEPARGDSHPGHAVESGLEIASAFSRESGRRWPKAG